VIPSETMSRSAVVALITGVALLVGFAVVANMYKHGLDGRAWWVIAITLGLGGYGALVTATSVRRLVDPKLETPWPVLIIAFVFIMMAAIGKAQRRKEEGDPNYLVSNDDSRKDSDPSDGPMGIGWASLATLLGLVMYGAGITLLWAFTSHPQFAHAKTAEKAPAPTPTGTPTPSVTTTSTTSVTTTTLPTTPPDILASNDLATAIDFARPHFTDDRGAPNRGAKLLVRYAAVKLTPEDLAIAKNETSLELVEKDPPKSFGKRLCVAGTLARIEKTSVDGTDAYSARLTTKTGDALELYAVGDTGSLVKRKPAKFCGVVTGRLDANGTPATFAVGMLSKP
jgi:hypothetical protein